MIIRKIGNQIQEDVRYLERLLLSKRFMIMMLIIQVGMLTGFVITIFGDTQYDVASFCLGIMFCYFVFVWGRAWSSIK